MKDHRTYGNGPYSTIVIHGGPGAVGDMRPVAEELSDNIGVIESLHTETTIDDQLEELKKAVESGDPPLTLVGHSWGAWLSFIFAAEDPSLVKKLILVSSGPFEKRYAKNIMKTRMDRLNKGEKKRFFKTMSTLDEDTNFENIDSLLQKTDSYDPIERETETEFHPSVYIDVWEEATELRNSGELLEIDEKIECPVTAIHGTYDPHPAEGVKGPLESRLEHFKFILLEDCGHYPWKEKEAKEEFFEILRDEID